LVTRFSCGLSSTGRIQRTCVGIRREDHARTSLSIRLSDQLSSVSIMRRAVVLLSAFVAMPAIAGPLGETVKGLNQASDSGRGGGSGGGGGGGGGGGDDSPPPRERGEGRDHSYDGSGSSGDDRYHSYRRHREPYYYYWGAPVLLTTVDADGRTVTAPSYPLTVEIYAGVARVEDSDGAFTADLHLTSNRFVIGGRYSHYWEGPSMYYPQGSAMGIWDADLGYQLLADAQGALTLEAGLAGVAFSPDAKSSLGGMIGARAVYWPSKWIALLGEARTYLLQDEIRANSLSAGVQLSFLRISYRLLDFNVGPPLHGPELGAAVRF
jgi:hypothetical protein